MAHSSTAISDGDRGDGTAVSRWLPSAPLAVSVEPSPTPHPHHSMTDALVLTDRMAALPPRVHPRTNSNPGIIPPAWRGAGGKNGSASTNRLAERYSNQS